MSSGTQPYAGGDNVWAGDDVTLNLSGSAASGISRYVVTKDDNHFETVYGASGTVELTESGVYTCKAYSNAGNESASQEMIINIDKANPTVTVTVLSVNDSLMATVLNALTVFSSTKLSYSGRC
jgi:hypothetical protein